jgi:hypothetical protein
MLTITQKSLPRHRLAALIALFVALSGPASAQSITAVTAATALLDRGYGKPQQHIDAEIGSYVARLPRPYDTTEEWEAAVKLELAMNQRPELEGETAEC